MAKKIVGALAALLLVLVVAVALQPDTYEVERSAVMPGPPEAVYGYVSDLREFEKFSPWADRDPDMTLTYGGPEGGVGQTYAWSGNDQVGQGRMTITEAVPNQRVAIDLEFIEPMPGTAKTAFTLEPVPEGTEVTWSMTGDNDFLGKAFGLFIDLEGMIGADYEVGLAKLEPVIAAEVERRAARAKAEPDPVAEPTPDLAE